MRRYIVRTDFGFAGCVVDSNIIELYDSEILDATGKVDEILADKIILQYEEEAVASQVFSELVPVDENGEPCEEGENIVDDDYNEPELDEEEAFASAGMGVDESYGG